MCDTTMPLRGGDLLLSNVTLYGEENTGVHERTHCKMNQLVYRVTKHPRPSDVCIMLIVVFSFYIYLIRVF